MTPREIAALALIVTAFVGFGVLLFYGMLVAPGASETAPPVASDNRADSAPRRAA